jgi:hypothetical protein
MEMMLQHRPPMMPSPFSQRDLMLPLLLVLGDPASLRRARGNLGPVVREDSSRSHRASATRKGTGSPVGGILFSNLYSLYGVRGHAVPFPTVDLSCLTYNMLISTMTTVAVESLHGKVPWVPRG